MAKRAFISLGGGCDVAWAFERLFCRHAGFPFDWLWNLDSGMQFVVDAIDEQFASMKDPDGYTRTRHRCFAEDVTSYSRHREVAHVHSNPLLLLLTTKPLPAVAIGRRKCSNVTTCSRTAFTTAASPRCLRDEAARFSSFITDRHPTMRFRLLVVLAAPPNQRERADEAMGSRPDQRNLCVRLGTVGERGSPGSTQHTLWEDTWERLLLDNLCMGGASRELCAVERRPPTGSDGNFARPTSTPVREPDLPEP